jgi:hypothetical protein
MDVGRTPMPFPLATDLSLFLPHYIEDSASSKIPDPNFIYCLSLSQEHQHRQLHFPLIHLIELTTKLPYLMNPYRVSYYHQDYYHKEIK